MIGLTLGTGVGGVIAIDGRVHQGHDGTAGELGHQTIDPDGPPCGCGNRGCLEAFARADRIAAACGTATAEAAVDAARAGDAAAVAGLGRGRALPRHRHRQHDRGRQPGRGRHRRRHRGRVRPAAATRSEAELRGGCTRRRSTRCEVVPAELGTWAGAIGAAIHGAETAERADPAAAAARAGRCREMTVGRRPAAVPPDRAGPARADRDAAAGRAAAIRRRAVRRVRGQPDDRPQRDAAAGRGRADHARAGPRQLRGRAARRTAGRTG